MKGKYPEGNLPKADTPSKNQAGSRRLDSDSIQDSFVESAPSLIGSLGLPPSTVHKETLALSFLLAAFLASSLFALLPLSSEANFLIGTVALALFVSKSMKIGARKRFSVWISAATFTLFLSFPLSFSNASEWSFLPPMELLSWTGICAAATLCLRGRGSRAALVLALSLCCVLLPATLLYHLNERMIWTDDHSTFFYRLSALEELFPAIPFYGPLWNAGFDARDFFPSGIINVFLLFYPIIQIFGVEQNYSLIATLVFLILPTVSIVIALRLLGAGFMSCLIGALLSLTTGLDQYKWGLSFGTLGFLCSAGLSPLIAVLSLKFLEKRAELSTGKILLLIALSSLALLWTPSGLALLPIAFCGLPLLPKLLKQSRFLLFVGLMLLANLPWLSIFWSASNVGSFLKESDASREISRSMDPLTGRNSRAKAAAPELGETLTELHSRVRSANPLLVLFLLPGLLLLPSGMLVRGMSALLVWLVLCATLIDGLIPKLELERFFLFFCYLAVIPSSLCIQRIIDPERQREIRLSLLSILTISLMIAGFIRSLQMINNQGPTRYTQRGQLTEEIEDAIEQFAGDGRAVFSGFVLHELDGGHLASIAFNTEKPLVASSYVHNLWRYKQVIPQEYLDRGESGYEEFFDLMNATAVFAHEKEWKKYFRSQPQKYQEVWSHPPFVMFQREMSSSYTLEGELLNLRQRSNLIEFQAGSSSMLLKFNYFPFLESSACDLNPEKIGETLEFIRLRNCPVGELVQIKSVSAWRRLSQ